MPLFVVFVLQAGFSEQGGETAARQELQALSSSIKALLAQWFAIGLLDLERCTWESPCSILEKVTGLCFVFWDLQ